MIAKKRYKMLYMILSVLMLATLFLTGCQSKGQQTENKSEKQIDNSKGEEENPPFLNVVLKPHSEKSTVKYVDVEMEIENPKLKEKDMLLQLPLKAASVPTAQYKAKDIKASDKNGTVPLKVKDNQDNQSVFGTMRQYLVQRKTEGDITIHYRADAKMIPGPYFDLRPESGGLTGSGLTFMAVPNENKTYEINLEWDLSEMPAKSSGVWTYGEGKVKKIGTTALLANSYYAAGKLGKYQDHNFSMYWLGKQDIDTDKLGEKIGHLYGYLSKLFKDKNEEYRVFIRKNPYDSTGGTALTRSYTFGYSNTTTPSVESLQFLMAHEMTHNWLSIQASPEESSLYAEGLAEYYSLLANYRTKMITEEEYVKHINQKLSQYYTNPYIKESLKSANDKAWQHHAAQTVPYGRGLIYMLNLDNEIKKAHNEKHSLDNLTIALLDKARNGEKYGKDEFFNLIKNETGNNPEKAYQDMSSGKFITPPKDYFPQYELKKVKEKQFDLGFDDIVFSSDSIVKGLNPDSNAAKSGLKNGDKILKHSSLPVVEENSNAKLQLTIERNNKTFDISYVPRGEEVTSYQYVKK
ncbi:hypothetical protein CJ480_03695 [Bacillus subtilis]|uniref:hypothetical protein n=1 Tax=Bacillus subtilis TaxID=1423 RepID=UPI000E746B96|nr:hypothetical protein [Bacillus subtilis]RJS50993.1 hypothetical protein CJ480_03695 [Bacillus subtilis]UQZ60491.1 hypothetical protein C2H93_18810 [Bacillus subtilis]